MRPDEGKGQQGRWGFQGGATLYVAQSTRVDREWTNPELDSFCVCLVVIVSCRDLTSARAVTVPCVLDKKSLAIHGALGDGPSNFMIPQDLAL